MFWRPSLVLLARLDLSDRCIQKSTYGRDRDSQKNWSCTAVPLCVFLHDKNVGWFCFSDFRDFLLRFGSKFSTQVVLVIMIVLPKQPFIGFFILIFLHVRSKKMARTLCIQLWREHALQRVRRQNSCVVLLLLLPVPNTTFTTVFIHVHLQSFISPRLWLLRSLVPGLRLVTAFIHHLAVCCVH